MKVIIAIAIIVGAIIAMAIIVEHYLLERQCENMGKWLNKLKGCFTKGHIEIGGKRIKSFKELTKCFKCKRPFGESNEGYVYYEGAYHFHCIPKICSCSRCGMNTTHLQGVYYSEVLSLMFCALCFDDLKTHLGAEKAWMLENIN
jgi:hypothetical protein